MVKKFARSEKSFLNDALVELRRDFLVVIDGDSLICILKVILKGLIIASESMDRYRHLWTHRTKRKFKTAYRTTKETGTEHEL
ncbi:hypothetical protein CEE45_04075 [Candidatus Heimdallarchaeota archaeon B3_Heim]|nr:MAG: hypothetical protein CEE45_04075 [Candidatus Heimdallarchaeota archaeon B3_Heim]